MFDYADLDRAFDPPLSSPDPDPQLPDLTQETLRENALDEPNMPEPSHSWRCMSCHSGHASWISANWMCDVCGATEFYDSSKPMKTQTQTGTWMYLPNGGEPAAASPASSRSRRRRRKRLQTGEPSEGFSGYDVEYAESEQLTHDPIVTPSDRPAKGLQPSPPKGLTVPDRVTAPVRHSSQQSVSQQTDNDRLLAALRKLIQTRSSGDDDDWNPRKGPERGIRWRTGQQPAAPQWKYDQQDMRAFAKFSKKVRIWEIQMTPFASKADQALLLWGSLTGDAEQELEHLTIDEVHCDTGIDTILRKLQLPFEQRAVFQKRKFLHEFESLRRYPSEVMRVYIQRFRRSIRNLQSVGIDITMSYDTEALGSRLLDRSGLTQDSQRMILVGTQQQLGLESIAEALVLQFPDFRGAPPIHGLQQKGNSKGKSTSSSSSASSTSTMARSSGKGSSSSMSRVMVVDNPESAHLEQITEAEVADDDDDAQQQADDDGDEPNDEDEAGDDDDNESLDLENLSQVLTVTAKKLAGLTLGRKFTTQRPKSAKDDALIAKKKQNSHCMACGERGHWKGDAACPMTPAKSSSYNTQNAKGATKGDRPPFRKQQSGTPQKSQAFTVVHHDHGCVEVTNDDQFYGNMFQCNMVRVPQEFQVHEVQAFSVKQFVGKLIIDSGCQRNCCGPVWYQHHVQALQHHGLQPHTMSCDDLFQFGKGEPLSARFRSYMPAGLGYMQCLLLGVAVVDAQVPLLGSHNLLEELQAIIDLPEKKIHMRKINVSLPLMLVSGHLTMSIDHFPTDVQKQLEYMSHDDVWKDPSPNCVFPPLPLAHSEQQQDQQQIKQFAQPDVHPTASMVGQMETSDGVPSGVQEERVHLHDGGSSSPYDATGMAADGSATRDGHSHQPDDMRAPSVRPLWKRNRSLRQVQEVPAAMEVGQSSGGMAGLVSKLICTVATFTAAITGGIGTNICPEVATTTSHAHTGSSGSQLDLRSITGGSLDGFILEPSSAGHGTTHGPRGHLRDQPGDCQQHGLLPPGASSRVAKNGTPGADRPPSLGTSKTSSSGAPGGGRRLRLGHSRRLQSMMKDVVKNLEAEDQIYKALPSVVDRPPPMIDVFELFSGSSKFTTMSTKFGLNALQPLDIQHGPEQGLKDPQVQREVWRAVRKFKPWFILMGLDCRLWNLFNINLNYSQRLELLHELQADEIPLVILAVELAFFQIKNDRYFMFENPQRSQLWSLEPVLELESQPQVWKTTLDTGAYGGQVHGHPIAKPMTFLGNIPELDEVINRRLTPEERKLCIPIEGSMTRPSQEYPDQLVSTILRHLKKIVQRREPQRFGQHHVLAVAQPSTDLQAWDDIVNHINQTFEKSSKRPFNIDVGSDLGKRISDLVRMDSVRIQCAHTPTTRRLPTNTMFEEGVTHRAALLQYIDGHRALEVEALDNLHQPKQRFERPVQLGIFLYGKMRDVPVQQPRPDDVEVPLSNLPTDITFPGLPTGHGINIDTRRTVARLHLNLGHPSPQELIRMVAYYGGAPSAVTTCIQHLHCATCERLKSPQQPRPATMPKFIAGQFGDEVQGDIFYLRLLSTEAIPILGLVDKATGFHQAAVCQGRNSADTFKVIMQCWLKPYGLPFKLLLDPDTAFRGEFQNQVESLGIIYDLCPAEAHWMIGMVERRNSILRCVLEKLVDQFAITDVESLDKILPLALHAVNSSTFTRGRTAYQAVFGRIPRLPGGLFTDDFAITSSPSNIDDSDNLLAKAEIIRSEAQKHLIDLNCNQQLRRALLRRTRITKFADIQPGQPCAFWRWQRRGQRKRGGWVLSRFLGWDPSAPTKLAWVQSGNTTVLISAEQLRTSTGFEKWTPSIDDIKALKDATKSFRDHLLQDETGPPPDEQHLHDQLDPQLEQPLSLQVPATPLPLPPHDQFPQQVSTLPLSPPVPPQHQDQLRQPDQQQLTQHTNLHLEQNPTYQQTNIYQRYGQPPTPTQLRQTEAQTQRTHQPQTPLPTDMQITTQHRRGRSRSPRPPALTLSDRQSATAAAHQPVSPPEAGTQPLEHQVGEDKPPGDTTPPLPQQPQPASTVEQPHNRTGEERQRLLQESLDSIAILNQQPTTPPALLAEQSTTPPVIDLTGSDEHRTTPHGVSPTPGLTPSAQPSNIPTPAAASSSRPPGAEVTDPATEDPYMPVEPLLPQKRTFDTMFMLHNDNGDLTHMSPWTDGSPPLGYGPQQTSYFRAYAATQQRQQDVQHINKDGNESDTTTHTDSDNDQPSTQTTTTSTTQRLTRQEAKQLDRELPWREIWNMPKSHIQKFLAAIEKEANSWAEWNSIRPLSLQEINEVKANPQLRRRILRSRAAYRDKNRGQGPLKAKCRIVALGHNDPDLYDLTRTSPTPGRSTEHLLYAMAVAGMNGELAGSTMKWKCWLGDAATAFLQGRQPDGERQLPLYMARPQDPLIAMTPFWKTELYEVLGNIYGLPNAPYLWCCEVINRLKSLGYVQHDFDRMLFMKYDHHGDVISLVMCYVDDFFGIHRSDYEVSELHQQFKWGELRYFEDGIMQTFKGKELCFLKNSEGRYTLKVTMTKFLETVEPYVLPKGRMQKDPILSPEQREFRSIAGCLQWLGSQARPELCPAISLSNHGQRTTIEDLKVLAETLKFAKDTKNYGFIIQDVPVNKESVILTFTDASWGNAGHSTSQMGIVITLTTPNVINVPAKTMLLDWRSARSPRVCRSTLAAEASSADEGSDRAAFINMMISEILYNEEAHRIGCKLDNLQATDSKSLYDSIVAINPNLTDKRSLVNIRAIQETVTPKQTRWVPTRLMVADGLTKLSTNLRHQLLQWLQNPIATLTDGSSKAKRDGPKKDRPVTNLSIQSPAG